MRLASRPPPDYIRSDNGLEFTAKKVRSWLERVEVKTLFIEPGNPWENGYLESFSGKLRDELLNREIFDTMLEAKVLVERWQVDYNTILRRDQEAWRHWPIQGTPHARSNPGGGTVSTSAGYLMNAKWATLETEMRTTCSLACGSEGEPSGPTRNSRHRPLSNVPAFAPSCR